MPMHQAIAIFCVSLLFAGLAALFAKRTRTALSKPLNLILIASLGAASSGVSALVATTRHAGTGFTTSHGWPKPFYFRYLSETGERSEGWSALYFIGNAMVFTACVSILWTAWSLSRRR